MKKDMEITPDEAKVLWTVLNRTWIPQGYHDEFVSGVRKLEMIATTEPQKDATLLINIL
jgi:hypothetical protein